MSDAFDHAFLAAIDDLNAGRLRDDPGHYLRSVPAARHAEFTRRLTALLVARGPADRDEVTADDYEAAVSAVAAVTSGSDSAGILADALRRLRKARAVERDVLIDALAAEYGVGPAGRDVLRRRYHELESGTLSGPTVAHRLLRSLARHLGADGEDFIAAAAAVARGSVASRSPLSTAPVMGRSAGRAPQRGVPARPARSRPIDRPDPDVELVERLFTGGPDA
jgi:hypothetical protein